MKPLKRLNENFGAFCNFKTGIPASITAHYIGLHQAAVWPQRRNHGSKVRREEIWPAREREWIMGVGNRECYGYI